MAVTEKTISSLIKTQLPDFIRADHPKFKRFLELYYQWLETDDPTGISAVGGNTVYQAMNIGDYRDIDQTPDAFLTFFKTELLPYFPENTALDIRKILKSAREFYSKKGSVESVKWLFKALFDEDIEIAYPRDQILKTSDGKWKKPKAFRITSGESNKSIDINLLKKKLVIGSVSGATCVIESANRTIDLDSGKEIIEIYISNIKRYFNNGEYINVNYTDANGVDRVFSEKIIGTISNIYLDSNIKTDPQQKRRGLLYNVGDPVVITGGLATSLEAQPAIAYVGNVSTGSIEAITTLFPGYGYTLYPTTEVIALRSPNDSQTANLSTDLRVFALNLNSNANSQLNFIEQITYDRSVIDYLEQTFIDDANYTAFTENNLNILLDVTEVDSDSQFYTYQEVWANGNNYFDALFTAKIATSNVGSIFGQHGSEATGPLFLYDVVCDGSLATVLSGAQINTHHTPSKAWTFNSITDSQVPANVDSQIFQYLNLTTANTGGIALIQVKNGGAGFRSAPSLLIKSEYDTLLSALPNTPSNHATIVQTFRDLGQIAHVYINNGGSGYANGDTITFSGRGYGTSAYVNVNATGTIIKTTITDRGEGHLVRPETFVNRSSVSYTPLTGTATVNVYSTVVTGSGTSFSTNLSVNKIIKVNNEVRRVTSITNATSLVVNSAFTANATSQTVYRQNGDEATLTAYLFGDGFDGTVDTSRIGRIRDIKLAYRGYDYVSRPETSLKVVDTVIEPILEIENFTEGEYIYQNPSVNSVVIAGTVNVSSNVVTGNTTGANTTYFIGNVVVGTVVTVGAESRSVTSVINNSSLTVNVAFNSVYTDEYLTANTTIPAFKASVKSYDRDTNLLRLYDYSGKIDATKELITANSVHCNVNALVNVAAPAQYPSAIIATGLPNPMYYGDGRAKALAAFANGLIEFNGFYLNTDGFLSADKVLEDGHTYHNYSYVIESERDLADYKTSLKNIAHPSGLINISKRIILNERDSSSEAYHEIHYLKPHSGASVQIANSYLNVVTGTSTSFLSKVNVGDLFIIDSGTSALRSISKTVSNVDSDTQLRVYGDFIYVGQGKATTNSGNTWLHITGATNAISDFIRNGDKIRMNLTSVTVSGTVNVSGTTVTGNTTGANTTHFVGNVVVGSEITVNNEIRTVTVVTDDSTLTVNSAFAHAATDKYLVANSILVKTITSNSGNILVMNSAYFATKTNLVYQVVPNYSSTSYDYKIITLTGN